ncbi:MAG TPA: insulinase family protein [Kofleriaceae bacterium]|nr:insulinase family protein [Kofleriaceae bacterium]
MKRLALVVVSVVVGCHDDPRFETLHETVRVTGDSLHAETFTLGNGLRVALLRDPRAAIASIDLRFEVGVGDDDKPGLALMVGELLAGHGSDAELTSRLEVDLDRTDLASTMFDLDGAMELAAQRLETTCDAFDPYALDEARERATATLSGIPPSLTAAVWGADHPYGRGIGDPHALAAITTDDACAHFTKHYGPSSATLVVTGAFDDNFERRLRARFERIAKTRLAPREAVPALQPGTSARIAVWGLAKPTAAIAYAMPALDAADEVMAELAMREVQTWDKSLHVALVGGRRGRALVIALEGDSASQLPKLRDKLLELVANHYNLQSDGSPNTPEDALDAAQAFDDPFTRGGELADLVVAGRSLDRLTRAKAWTDLALSFHWLRLHVFDVKPRELALLPTDARAGGVSLDALADPASAIDRAVAAPHTPVAAVPVRAISRPITDYMLANGLRVVLAPDPASSVVDVRLVEPIGSRDEPAPGLAMQAALELEAADAGWDANEKVDWYDKRLSLQDAVATPSRTRFRVVGFSALADWHLWALAFRVTTGRFEHATAALARWKAHFVPAGATLIVAGGFDPTQIRTSIETWFAPWRALDAKPIVHARGPGKPVVELGDDGALAIELGYRLDDDAKTTAGAAIVLAAIAQQRLADATRGMIDATFSYDAGDRRLAIAGNVDPSTVAQLVAAIDRELDALRDTPVQELELERAKRTVIAERLGGVLGASGRAHELEERVAAGTRLDAPTDVGGIEAASADDLRAAAGELFARGNRAVAVHGSKADSDRVLTALGIDPATALRR